jgi:hypothetical protein
MPGSYLKGEPMVVPTEVAVPKVVAVVLLVVPVVPPVVVPVAVPTEVAVPKVVAVVLLVVPVVMVPIVVVLLVVVIEVVDAVVPVVVLEVVVLVVELELVEPGSSLLTRMISPVVRFARKMLGLPELLSEVSPDWSELNAIQVPSWEIEGFRLPLEDEANALVDVVVVEVVVPAVVELV